MLEALLAGDDGFSDEEIVDFLVALLVAGYETTSTIMTLAVKFLTETPLALAQLKVCFQFFSPFIIIIISLFPNFVCVKQRHNQEYLVEPLAHNNNHVGMG